MKIEHFDDGERKKLEWEWTWTDWSFVVLILGIIFLGRACMANTNNEKATTSNTAETTIYSEDDYLAYGEIVIPKDQTLDWKTFVDYQSVNELRAKDYIDNIRYVKGFVFNTHYDLDSDHYAITISNDLGTAYPLATISIAKDDAINIDVGDFVVLQCSIYIDNENNLFSSNLLTIPTTTATCRTSLADVLYVEKRG